MKRRHLIELKPSKDKNYRYIILFTDTVADVGTGFFAQTEDEVIKCVAEHAKPEPVQLRLW